MSEKVTKALQTVAAPVSREGDQRSGFVFLIPSDLTRDASVVGFMPNNTAAPFAPNIFPLVSRKACEIFSRS